MNLSTLSKLTEDEAREMLERSRWASGPVCPKCGCVEGHTKFKGKKHRAGVWKCNKGCAAQFTVTVGTVFGPNYTYYAPFSTIPQTVVTQYHLTPGYRYVTADGYVYVVDPHTYAVTRVIAPTG